MKHARCCGYSINFGVKKTENITAFMKYLCDSSYTRLDGIMSDMTEISNNKFTRYIYGFFQHRTIKIVILIVTFSCGLCKNDNSLINIIFVFAEFDDNN